MKYLFTPNDQHFDLGFGVAADSFKQAGDVVLLSHADSPSPNLHLPANFLYRHAIELYLKSGIFIFHKKFSLQFENGLPMVLVGIKNSKPIDKVHDLQQLFTYFRSLVSNQTKYLAEHTNTDWSFHPNFDKWISDIEATDSSGTFFRYPVTKHHSQDKNKSVYKGGNFQDMVANIGVSAAPLKAFVVLDSDGGIATTFQLDDTRAKKMTSPLKGAVDVMYGYNIAMRMELTNGR